MCADEFREMILNCRPSFVITDKEHIDRVHYVAATETKPSRSATDFNVQ